MTLRSILETAGAIALALTATGLAIERRHAYAEHLASLNAAALADSTHRQDVGNLEVAHRQAEQLKVALDARTHDKNALGTALANLAVRFSTLQATTEGTVARDTTTAGFIVQGRLDALDSLGVAVDAHVVASFIPAPRAVWAWQIERAPLDLTVDFACQRDTAVTHVTGPRWAAVDISKAVQRPDICNPPPTALGLFAFKLPSLPVAGLLVVTGYILGRVF